MINFNIIGLEITVTDFSNGNIMLMVVAIRCGIRIMCVVHPKKTLNK